MDYDPCRSKEGQPCEKSHDIAPTNHMRNGFQVESAVRCS